MFVQSIPEMMSWSQSRRSEGKTLGFVPTMGALHEGHASLVRRAKAENDFVVLSIFVNPLQFGPKEDFDRYPRRMEEDRQLAQQAGADLIFTTTPEQMYPKDFSSYVSNEKWANQFEGAVRPGHFRGVLTVVLKLLQITKPHRTYFGQKDAQQLALIQRMVRDFHLDVEVVPCPTVRTAEGLAMSSRNAYLSAEEKQKALALIKCLRAAQALYLQGERDAGKILATAGLVLKAANGVEVDYLALVDPQNWSVLMGRVENALLIVAARVGTTRLIDNLRLGEDNL